MKITGETLINNVHFARFIVLVYHSIPFQKLIGDHFGGDVKRNGDHFGVGQVGDHFGAGIIEDAVQHFKTSYDSSADQKAFTAGGGGGGRVISGSLQYTTTSLSSAEASLHCGEAGEKEKESGWGTMGRGKREERFPPCPFSNLPPCAFCFSDYC